ncbi:MAG: hypothetical protein N3E39_03085 [Candidatus Methanomethylicia archaeon]|nr:hypothetical protein [Candidatus Methanomethylicia archaeon]
MFIFHKISINDVYLSWTEQFNFDLAGIIAAIIILLYVSLTIMHEDKRDIELTNIIKTNFIPKLTSNLMEVNGYLDNFEGKGIIPPSLVNTLYNGLSITLLSELNSRLPKFASIFRSYIEDLKYFDSLIHSSLKDTNDIYKLCSKIKVNTNTLINEISKIKNMKKLPAKQGGFASLRR